MSDIIEEGILDIVSSMEEDGIDFKEEVGTMVIPLLHRDDLHVEIVVVDKETYNLFNQYKVISNDPM